jgi:uncharacterized protein YndB with AHSA1/START domain
MLIKIVLTVVIAAGLLLIYVSFQPKQYSISRRLRINSPAETIFPLINSSKKMNQWMPWSEMDPQMKITYSGPEEGVGAKSEWTSDGKMGVGSATIVEVVPNSSVTSKLVYTKPFEGTQIAKMLISNTNGASEVIWSVTGENTFVQKLVCVFMNMDKMVGGHFETGLEKLKAMSEESK